ncbi:MAG TPA: hypothetical protein PK867_15120 [Pirellulales bacterium]|nr:hypothetical protein [Pirellulales bacterium]
MSINRSKLWLALGLQLVFASMTLGQETPDNEWLPGVRDFQPFGPASDTTSTYGSGPKQSRGWFFTIEDLAWSTSAPDRTSVGAPLNTPGVNDIVSTGVPGGFMNQTNTLDTGFITSPLRQGERLQLGYVGDDGLGWMVGTFVLHSASSFGQATDAGVAFSAPVVNGISPLEGFIEQALPVPANQPGFGTGTTTTGQIAIVDADINHNGVFGGSGRDIGTPNANPPPTFVPPRDGFPDVPAPTDLGDLVGLPIFFSHVVTKYTTNVWGIELMRTYQLSRNRRADHGYWDFMAGARYIRFRDNFYFDGTGYSTSLSSLSGATGGTTSGAGGTAIAGLLSDTNFTTATANYLVGPQIALRWTKQRGRLGWNAEGRFMTAANFQTTTQNGAIAQRPDAGTLQPTFFVFNPQPNTSFLSTLNSTTGTGTTGTGSPVTLPQFRVPALTPTGVANVVHRTTFAPVGELRLNANYRIFKNVQATVGWTGLVMGGIGRSTNMTSYALPAMGILSTGSRQTVLIQGLNVGININH